MTKKIRIGVAGLGAVAQSVHLPLINRRWDLFELAAVADLSPTLLESVGEHHGVSAEHRYERFEDMLAAEQLDGVLILTSGSHGTPALQAIRAGVAVFCEKPLAFSQAEVDLLEQAESEAGRPMLLLAYMKEYDPAVTALRDALPALAAIRYVDVEVLHPTGPSQLAYANLRPAARDIPAEVLAPLIARDAEAIDAAIGTDAPAAFRSLYTDVIAGSLIHDIAVLRSLLGSIQTVSGASQWANDADAGSVEVSGTIADGAHLHMHWHYLPEYPTYHETITIHHTTGSLQLEFTVPYLLNAPTELRIVERAGAGESRRVVRDITEAFENELVAFHRLAAEGAPAPTGIAQGREDLVTAQRIARALGETLAVTVEGESRTA